MTTQVTSAGWQGTAYSDRRLAFVASLRAAHPTLAKVDFGADTPEGQIIDRICEDLTDLDESGEAAFNAIDPLKATDAAALAVARLRGVSPREASKTQTASVTVNLDAGTYPAGSLVAYVDGEPDNRHVNKTAVTAASTDDYSVDFEAEIAGSEFTTPAGELTQMIAVSGWNSVTNPTDGVPGRDADTPAITLARSEALFYLSRVNKLEGIRAAVLAVDGVIDCKVVNGSGSVNVIVWDATTLDADNGEIAAAIWSMLPPGIGTTGATADTSTGYGVNFDRATVQRCYVDADYTGVGVDQDEVIAALQAAMPDELGETVVWAKLVAAVLSVSGVTDVTLNLSLSSPPSGTANITTADNKISNLDSADITFG